MKRETVTPFPRLAVVPLAFALVLTSCPQVGVICNTGEVRCGNVCARLSVDPLHCGACGIGCSTGFVCENSACVCDPALGLTACGQACVDVRTDPAHCGQCGNTCPSGQVCSQGTCGASCGVGELNCNGGCIDVTSDASNCGACGNVCGQGLRCVSSVCRPDLVAACFNSGELFGLDAQAEVVSPSVATAPPSEPIGIAFHGASQLEVADFEANKLYSFNIGAPTDGGTWYSAQAGTDTLGSGAQAIAVSGDVAYVLNSNDHTLDAFDLTKPAGQRLMCPDGGSGCTFSADFGANTFPWALTVGTDSVFVSLYGNTQNPADTSGNKIARVNLQGFATSFVDVPLDIDQFPADGGYAPRPAGLAFSGGKLFVALANLSGFTAAAPSEIAIFNVVSPPPSDGSSGLAFVSKVSLGANCLNADGVLLNNGVLYVACGGKYELVGSDYVAQVPGAVAALNLTTQQQSFAPQLFACEPDGGPSGCAAGSVSRLALAAGKIFAGDTVNGYLFTVDPTSGQVLRGADNPIVLCPGAAGGPGNFVSDLAAVPSP
jgi:hypothetical protein